MTLLTVSRRRWLAALAAAGAALLVSSAAHAAQCRPGRGRGRWGTENLAS